MPWYLSTPIHLPIGEELHKIWPLMQNPSSLQFPSILSLCCGFSISRMQWSIYLCIPHLRLINFQKDAKFSPHASLWMQKLIISLWRSWLDVFSSLSTKNFAIFSQVSSMWAFSELHHRPTVHGQRLQKCLFFDSSDVFYLVLLLAHELFKLTTLKFNFALVDSEGKSYVPGGANTAPIWESMSRKRRTRTSNCNQKRWCDNDSTS